MRISVQEVMDISNVKFGTSGARGLAESITDYVCYVYTKGFLQYLNDIGQLKKPSRVAVAGDLRPSTDNIMRAVCRTAAEMGHIPVNCGKIPSPAVALYGLVNNIPAIMVTGSHIPADRNGIKFNKSDGEILKVDEEAIRKQIVEVDENLFDTKKQFFQDSSTDWPVTKAAEELYTARFLDFFPPDCLKGKRIGVYQHSAVGRSIMLEIMQKLGAEAVPLGFSRHFIPVDTEAIRPEDVEAARSWSAEGGWDAIISTDGDSDRPLISDENGNWLRGDVAGILCAKYLNAEVVCTPVSCNTALEKSNYFKGIKRTRIGSPFVIAAMNEAVEEGADRVVGYEANGGFLINSSVQLFEKSLRPLPTRDAFIVHLTILLLSSRENKTISELLADLPVRFTFSGRLQNFPLAESKKIIAHLSTDNPAVNMERINALFGGLCGKCLDINRLDGVRLVFENQEIVHLRPSGNAPEFRCYNEADSKQRAVELNAACMKILAGFKV